MTVLSDEELRNALRTCPKHVLGAIARQWPYAKEFARAVADAAVAADRAGRGEPISLNLSHDKAGGIYPEAKPEMVVPQEKAYPTIAPIEYELGYVDGWNACRATMLAAAPEPTT